ncbi:M14 metallopeptidase family protein [Maribacter sp. 2307ULW6-5]|uniref:M14 family metallopeptidase n=1 Tax=Maribacter sp. 2307ULW6-5 TaxID=3386275 RepID=UPI0039BCC350
MKLSITCLGLLCCLHFSHSQKSELTSKLYNTYERYKEPSLDKRRIKYADLQPLIGNLRKNKKFQVTKVGTSIGGRDLNLVSVGSGDIPVFLWSQMHGDEPTATQAIFDILNFLDSADDRAEKEQLLSKVSLHFLPMLNPDGAELFQRRNLLGVDLNRDALRLQSPESKTLKRVRDSLDARFGFNLHDQSTYYNAERTERPATISYLAPAYNYEKDINGQRANAMKIIVFMNNIIQEYAPGQVGRYNDDFEPRAFGDNIQKWGTSTILIESGGFPNDVEKQEIRKLNYVSILAAIHTIANGSYRDIPLEDYERIPENDRKLFDLKILGATYELKGQPYIIDLGINRLEVDLEDHSNFWYSSRVVDQGDLSTFYGYQTLEATGMTLVPARVYPTVMDNAQLNNGTFPVLEALREGYAYVRTTNLPAADLYSALPLHKVGVSFSAPELALKPGVQPTFFLRKGGNLKYAVINGFLLDLGLDQEALLRQFRSAKGNAMLFR